MGEKKLLEKKLDDIIRLILKKQYPLICVTCGRHVDWYKPRTNAYGLQVGHYISRRFKAVRWDLRNVHPQCSSCNWKHRNNPAPYTAFLIRTYGKEVIVYLEEKAQKDRVVKISVIELRQLLVDLTNYYNAL